MKKITQNHKDCIGCGTCVTLCQMYWELRDDMKAHLKGGKYDEKKDEYELEVKDAGCNESAAEACPVQVIKIEEV